MEAIAEKEAGSTAWVIEFTAVAEDEAKAWEAIVAEMGARREGDVRLLCQIARPSVVVVTNVGVAHLEIFGSWDRIVEASAEPVDALEADGVIEVTRLGVQWLTLG